LTFLELISNLN